MRIEQQRKYVRSRRTSGQQLIEVTCGLLFLVPIFLFLFDISFMYFATNLSDGVARDAARAAAQVEPEATKPGVLPLSASPNAKSRADAVVTLARSRTSTNGYIRRFELDPESDITIDPPTPARPQGGVPDRLLGGPWLGTVRVRTVMFYVLPVSIPKVTPDELRTTAEAVFPITANKVGEARDLVQ